MADQAMKRFTVTLGKHTTHKIYVLVYKNRAAMRGALTKAGHKDSSSTAAACWQANRPGLDSVVAEIHLPGCGLTLDNIIHESTHAAYHRARLVGIPPEHKDFEEWISDTTGTISETIFLWLDKNKFKIRFSNMKGRRAISVKWR